ncbi:hypothetical protein LJR074_004481 [Acidovorax sp. LjRoot74]
MSTFSGKGTEVDRHANGAVGARPKAFSSGTSAPTAKNAGTVGAGMSSTGIVGARGAAATDGVATA